MNLRERVSKDWPWDDLTQGQPGGGLLPDCMIRSSSIVLGGEPETKRPGTLSYGWSGYGYNVRLNRNNFKVFTNALGASLINPKAFDERSLVSPPLMENEWGTFYVLPPQTYALGETVETFDIPREILGVCVGKSTYARCGIAVNVTPLEPEWKGRLTLEISNDSPLPVMIFTDEGIAQILFIMGMADCEVSYRDKKGIYQDQSGMTTAKVHESP